MKNKKDKEYQNLIKDLKRFTSISASDDLKDEIILLSKTSSNGNSHLGGLFFTRAIAFVLVIFLLTGGTTLVAAQRSKPGEVLYPVRQALDKVRQETPFSKQINEEADIDSTGDDQDTNQSTQSAETKRSDDQHGVIDDQQDENEEQEVTDIKDEENLPTSKKNDVLGEIKETLPEEAQDAVNNAIENPSPNSNDKNQDNKQGQEKSQVSVGVKVNPPENAESAQEENQGLKIDLNLPF